MGGAPAGGWGQGVWGSCSEDSSGSKGHRGTGSYSASNFMGGRGGGQQFDHPSVATHSIHTYILSPPARGPALLHAPAVVGCVPLRGYWVCPLPSSACPSGGFPSMELRHSEPVTGAAAVTSGTAYVTHCTIPHQSSSSSELSSSSSSSRCGRVETSSRMGACSTTNTLVITELVTPLSLNMCKHAHVLNTNAASAFADHRSV